MPKNCGLAIFRGITSSPQFFLTTANTVGGGREEIPDCDLRIETLKVIGPELYLQGVEAVKHATVSVPNVHLHLPFVTTAQYSLVKSV